MDTFNPILDNGIGNIIGVEIGKAKTDSAFFFIGYKNKIAAGMYGVRFQPGWRWQLLEMDGIR
jgi:hypothetical protein